MRTPLLSLLAATALMGSGAQCTPRSSGERSLAGGEAGAFERGDGGDAGHRAAGGEGFGGEGQAPGGQGGPGSAGVGGSGAGTAHGGEGGASEPVGGSTSSAGADGAGEGDGGEGGAVELPCESSLPLWPVAPAWLSETSLYVDIAQKLVAPEFAEFSPQFALWSDGAAKRRWMYLPSSARVECGGTIDNAHQDQWRFPVGARAFKEFMVSGRRIETRLVHRFGAGPDDFLYAHYLWNDDESDAVLITNETAPELLTNPKGTDYTVPAPSACVHCHGNQGAPEGGLPSRFLGFSALQLSHDGPGLTLAALNAAGRLSFPTPDQFSVPGNEVERAALGYLHSNCGFCHNRTLDGVQFPAQPLSFLLRVTDDSVAETGAYTTALGVDVIGYESASCTDRAVLGDAGLPDEPESCILERMGSRTPGRQMPPLATKKVDAAGLAIIERWLSPSSVE